MESRLGYVLGALCLATGMAFAGWFVWSELAALQTAFIRVVVPGSAELTLNDPGTYTIFHEAESVVDGQLYSAPNIAGLTVTVTSASDGKPVPMTVPVASSTYTVGGHSGRSVFAVTIAQPGKYRLTATYAAGKNGPQTVLAISQGFAWGLVKTILGALVATFAGFGAALALVLTTFFRRRRMQRALGA